VSASEGRQKGMMVLKQVPPIKSCETKLRGARGARGTRKEKKSEEKKTCTVALRRLKARFAGVM
jgi:hypothetical protein